jgi:hypothetical protein
MIRDRKMYVAPTPFGLATGVAHQQTLILPSDFRVDACVCQVGRLVRREAEKLVVGYAFDLRHSTLSAELVANPDAGREHHFCAYRLKDAPGDEVSLRPRSQDEEQSAEEDEQRS